MRTSIPGGVLPIAAASGLAFLVSEVCDFAVYTPLRERSLTAAVGVSQVVGALVDSALFLWIAFGAVTGPLFFGQVLGKTVMVLPVLAVLVLRRRTALRLMLEEGAA